MSAIPTAREHLSRARDRVVAMGTVYRYLYQANASDHIEFSSFLKLICEESQNAYAGAHKPTISVEVRAAATCRARTRSRSRC